MTKRIVIHAGAQLAGWAALYASAGFIPFNWDASTWEPIGRFFFIMCGGMITAPIALAAESLYA